MILASFLLLLAAGQASEPPGFWVWHRHDPLRPAERAAVQSVDGALFWHVGEFALSGSAARWQWREAAPPEPDAVPVVRLDLTGKEPFRQPGLTETLARLADSAGRLQIDCDCPDRLLDHYAAFLTELRRRVPRLSATALAGWCARPAFAALQGSIESLAVMFYDLQPDPACVGADAPPLPLLNPHAFVRQLAAWDGCRIPWQAGLPNFSRVTVYDATGRCRGHIRNWTWDEVTFQPGLKVESTPAPGVVTMRATADLAIAESAVKTGALIAVRWPDREALSQALDAVAHSHASGVVWFRLPDSSDASGWSVGQLSHLAARPSLHLRLVSNDGSFRALVLSNDSTADLPPRIAGNGPDDRGYALELDAPDQVWREALPGEFWRVGAHAHPEGKPAPVPIPFATRLTFWFSHLRAGESLKTGLIQLAPEAAIGQIRYRIAPGEPAWKPLD